MSYDQMVDLLKTSVAVSLVVLPAGADGGVRRGCLLASCGAPPPSSADCETAPGGRGRQPAGRLCRPAAASPPPSVISSGYGTGSSGRSTLAGGSLETGGTLSSSSSGSTERWVEEAEPPPLPLRHRHRPQTSSNYAAPAGLQPRSLQPLQVGGPDCSTRRTHTRQWQCGGRPCVCVGGGGSCGSWDRLDKVSLP